MTRFVFSVLCLSLFSPAVFAHGGLHEGVFATMFHMLTNGYHLLNMFFGVALVAGLVLAGGSLYALLRARRRMADKQAD